MPDPTACNTELSKVKIDGLVPEDQAAVPGAAKGESPLFSVDLDAEGADAAMPKQLSKLLAGLDPDGEGQVSQERLEEATDILKTIRQAKENNSASLSYTYFPDCVKEVFKTWDADGNGFVSITELQSAARAWQKKDEKLKFFRWAVLVLVMAVLLLSASNFCTAYFAAEMAQHVRTSGSALVTAAGSPALVSSADFKVSDGILLPRNASTTSENRRMTSCEPGDASCSVAGVALATRTVEIEKAVSSTIPDKLLSEMKKLQITGRDGISHMTIHVLGFSRVLAPSKCGSLVYLSGLHGNVILDDNELYFDTALQARAAELGIDFAEATSNGRRLASGNKVAGLFNFFEDYEWQCESVQRPRSPSRPYVMKTLRKIPCPNLDLCVSDRFSGATRPGFDEESSSVITVESIAHTDEFTLSVQRFPNHPFQELVSLTDHVQKTHTTMQVFNGSAYRCRNQNYSAAVGNTSDTMDSYFPAFVGKEDKIAESFILPWGVEEIPERKVRVFRLQPKDDADGALPVPIDYEDDQQSLLPTKLHFNGARELNMDVEEILVQSLLEKDEIAAQELFQTYNLACSETDLLDLPTMISPLSEKASDVDFYVEQYINKDLHADEEDTTRRPVGYWNTALLREDSSNVGNISRRLLSPRVRRLQALDGSFEVDFGRRRASLSASISGECMTVAGETDSSTSPWTFSGEMNLGKECSDPSSKFTIDGKVGVNYGWEIQKKYTINIWPFKAKVDFSCELGISGYIGGKTGSYKYNCGRRMADISYGSSNETQDSQLEDSIDINEEDAADSEQMEADDADDVAVPGEDKAGRRLAFWDRRRRRRRRRRRTCTATGFEINAGIGVDGGCSVGRRRIGVGLEGGLDLTIGPWPSPLDDRATGTISAQGCISLGPFSGCVGFPTINLFDVNI